MSWVKGIKKGQTIELLTEIDVPDGQEVLINIQGVDTFWTLDKKSLLAYILR